MGNMSSVMMALLPVVLAMMAQRRGGATQTAGPAGGGLGGLGGLLGSLLGSSGGGGLGDLLAGFERAGFGTQAQSWVGRGTNQALPTDGLEKVFGPGALAEIARQAGVSEADASSGLSQLLPEVVDRLTPEGQVPQADALVASVQSLARQFGVR
jgi:uncharacterized protein YidB (DUF937 family)